MRRRWWPLSVTLLVAACGTSSGVALVSSDPIPDETTIPDGATTVPPPTTDEGDPPFTLPPPPSTPASGEPSTAPTDPPPDSTATTVPAADLPVPPDCTPLPEDAPSLLVTTTDGVVYEVGAGGTQIVADSEDLDAPISSAWRAEGGALWVSLGAGMSVGRLDAGRYTESGSGSVSLQHVGVIDGDPVALWFDVAGQFEPGATEGGRVVVEHADGTQDDLGPAWTPEGSVNVGNIGADTVLLTRTVAGEQVFEYLDGEGRPAHDDWFDPTDSTASADVQRSAVAVSNDGQVLVWTEQERAVGSVLELVIGRTSGPEIQQRVALARPEEQQMTGDFDGRWALASLSDGFAPTRTVLVDTTTDEPEPIVPCVPLGSATIDRAGGGGSTPPTTPPTTASATTTPTSTTDAESVPPGTTPSTAVGGDPIDP